MFINTYQIHHAIRNGISIPGAGGVQISAGTIFGVRSDFTFSNSPSVTFGLNGAGVITASVGPAGGGLTNIKVSAGIASELRSDITFSNSNGISFGLNAGTITATVATNYQPPGAYLTTAQPPGAYLTTAMLSDASSVFAGTGFTTATTAGTNIVGTLNTSGLSMGIPAYLTAAAGGGITNVAMSVGTVSTLASAFTFSNSNNVTFGLGTGVSAGVITASFSAAGGGGAGTNTSVATIGGTDLTFAVNTSGVTIGYPAWITTATGGGGGTQATLSYFVHPDQAFPNVTASFYPSNSSFYADPFILPCAASFDYLRFAVYANNRSTAYGTSTVQTSYSASLWTTFLIGIYTMNTGLNSQSLTQYASTSAGLTMVWSLAETGSQYTASLSVTYPTFNGTTSTSQNFQTSSASIILKPTIGALANFGPVGVIGFLDFPFSTSLSAGNYWMMVGHNTTHSTQGDSRMSNAWLGVSWAGVPQLSYFRVFTATNGLFLPGQLGLGYLSNNATNLPTVYNVTNILANSDFSARLYWQGIRQA